MGEYLIIKCHRCLQEVDAIYRSEQEDKIEVEIEQCYDCGVKDGDRYDEGYDEGYEKGYDEGYRNASQED